MNSNGLLKERLESLRAKIRRGEAAGALQSLNLMLAQHNRSPSSLPILVVMAEALVALEDEEGAARLIERTLKRLRRATPGAAHRHSKALLSLAELLAVRGRADEALVFAEEALEKTLLSPGEFESDQLIDLLSRYAEIARLSGNAELAREAYTYALLIAHIETGVQFEVAPALLSLTEKSWGTSPSGAMKRVARLLSLSYAGAR